VTILPDVLAPGLKVVFCGTAAGDRSARVAAYYAGPGNRFWDTLFETGLTPKRLTPCQFRDVLRYGIGLTDLVKTAKGPDASLPSGSFDPEGLRKRLREVSPDVLAFNGKKSAKSYFGRSTVEYGRQAVLLGSTTLFVLPSTSGAARGYWDSRHWHDLAKHLRSGELP
jgi:TDG/mug DNA glycosylase family protein